MREGKESGMSEPWEAAALLRGATKEEVMTALLIAGTFKAELRIEDVPWMAGRMMSFSGLSGGLGWGGDGRCVGWMSRLRERRRRRLGG